MSTSSIFIEYPSTITMIVLPLTTSNRQDNTTWLLSNQVYVVLHQYMRVLVEICRPIWVHLFVDTRGSANRRGIPYPWIPQLLSNEAMLPIASTIDAGCPQPLLLDCHPCQFNIMFPCWTSRFILFIINGKQWESKGNLHLWLS